MKLLKTTLITLSLASLAACHPSGPAPSSAPTGTADNVATVNGTPVSRDLYNYYIKGGLQGKDPSTLSQQQKDDALNNLVRGELVAQQADKDGITKQPDTVQMLELARLSALQQAFIDKFSKENKPTEDELKKEYDVQVGLMPHTEYHVAHILVSSEAEASKLIAQLDKGAKFADLAKKNSSDPSKAQGGDLGWIKPEGMVKPFADAMITLKAGEYTHTPVQSQFGWHVIKMLETRPVTPPPFESVKDRLPNIVLGKKYKAYMDGLQSKAQIEKKL